MCSHVHRRYRKRRRLTRDPQKQLTWRAPTDDDWGRYDADRRLNMDQVPFNLDNAARRSYIQVRNETQVLKNGSQHEPLWNLMYASVHL